MSEARPQHPAPAGTAHGGTAWESTPPQFLTELDTLIRARYPLLYLVSWEEQRVENMLERVATAHGKTLFGWSSTKGLRRLGGTRGLQHAHSNAGDAQDPMAVLAAIEKLNDPSLVVLKDFHPYLNDPNIVRAMRELSHGLKSTFTTVIVLSPVLNLPAELEKEMTVLDIPLPTLGELWVLLRDIVAVVRQGGKATVQMSHAEVERFLKAMMGLTLVEAENVIAKAIAKDGRLDASDVDMVLAEKKQVIRKSGLLEFYEADASLATVGGMDNLKTWLDRRATAFGEKARQFGLPEPKGLLLLGVQGCGKSLTAKAIASTWHLPLLRLDMGRIFSGLVGSSEENLRRALRVAESVAPTVLWVDEIEKGLAGMASSGSTDSGVTARVFGYFLTWLQEKTAPVFVVATANRVDALPPELLRRGRFDEIFFIDLPAAPEREQIFRIHLARRKRNPDAFDTAQLAARAEGFSGAEIEQVVISALYDAFAEPSDLASKHLLASVAELRPLSQTMREQIDALRTWAATRTRPASSEAIHEATAPLSVRFA